MCCCLVCCKRCVESPARLAFPNDATAATDAVEQGQFMLGPDLL
eukprot:gene26161-25160_t